MRKLLKVAACLVLILAFGLLAIMPVQAPQAGYVHSLGYWRTHNTYADVPALREPWPIVEDSRMCDMTFFEIVTTPTEGCAWRILAQQYIVAILNALNGADVPPDVYQAMSDAQQLLWSCPVPVEDREYAISLAEILTAYNEGLLGPPPYPD